MDLTLAWIAMIMTLQSILVPLVLVMGLTKIVTAVIWVMVRPTYFISHRMVLRSCIDAQVGDTGIVNGVTYTKVDRALLTQLSVSGWDTKCTSGITDMSSLYPSNNSYDISTWDTSDVTTMSEMFYHADNFNEDIIEIGIQVMSRI